MGRFLYPVDTDQFANIRERGKLYVDKTDMVYDLVFKYDYVFLARPRRFGKSLLCNTFDAYFNGRKELFEGLKIMDLETEWKKYPVLHFVMSGFKNLSVDGTVEEALSQIDDKDYAVQWSADGRRVTKCGVIIDSDKRNITVWQMTDMNGTVIEEQTF